MADDIVTRLWQYTPEAQNSPDATRALLNDAADEIERLRTALQDAWSAADMLATQLERISSGNTDVLREYDQRREDARNG